MTIQSAFEEIATKHLIPTPDNPRVFKDDDRFKSLVKSVAELGILEPLLARKHPTQKGKFDLRAGERRWRAACVAGLESVPVIVREMDDRQAMEITISENLHRDDLSPLEESRGINSLLALGHEVDAIASDLGHSRKWVLRRAKLHELIPAWRDRSDISHWSIAHLEMIAPLPVNAQEFLAEHYGERYEGEYTEPVPDLRELQGMIHQKIIHNLSSFPWKLTDANLLPAAGPCSTCTKRTSCQPELFDLATGKGKKTPPDCCLDSECATQKLTLFIEQRIEKVKEEHGECGFIADQSWCLPDALKANRTITEKWRLTDAKPGDKGAKPYLHLDGGHAGKITWAKSDRATAGGMASSEKPSGPKSLAERREGLDARRAAHVVKSLIERLNEARSTFKDTIWETLSSYPDIAVIRIASVFGTARNLHEPDHSWCDWRSDGMGHGSEDPWDRFKNADARELTQYLWREILDVWISRLRIFDTKSAPTRLDDAREIADWLKLDFEGLHDEADKAIPEPKAWIKLAEEEKLAKKSADKKPKKKQLDPIESELAEATA